MSRLNELRTKKELLERRFNGLSEEEKKEQIQFYFSDLQDIGYEIEKERKKIEVCRYGQMAMDYMKEIYKSEYIRLEDTHIFKNIFDGLEEKCNSRKWELFEIMIEDDKPNEDFNVLEITAHKNALMHKAEEVMMSELVHINHFDRIDVKEYLQ